MTAMNSPEAIVVDIETVAIDEAPQFLEPIEPPSNYSKPEAIASYVTKATERQLSKCALDPDLCRIVAIGTLRVGIDSEPFVLTCEGEHEERYALGTLWDHVRAGRGRLNTLVTFNGLRFDLPVLMRRSQYLGVDFPWLVIDRYRTPHIDLWQKLGFNGAVDAHGLSFYAKRFQLPGVIPETTGADIAGLVASAEWDLVKAHCASDVSLTYHLAARLGFIESPEDVDPKAQELADVIGF